MRRAILLAAALAIPISGASLALVSGGQASASSSIQCTSLKGNISSTVTIGKCTPTGGKGYKSATGNAAALATGGTITWSKSGATTTIGSGTVTQPTNLCGKKATEYGFTSTVTAASTTGTGIPAVGDTVSALACVTTSSGAIKLLKGTVMEL
jgi:hypothetical protein